MSLHGSPTNHVFFKAGRPYAAALKRPYAEHLTAPGMFKFSTPHKAAIKFQAPTSGAFRPKPEFVYEKVNVPKHPEPVRYSSGSEGGIHTIAAPNLSLNDNHPVPEVPSNNLNHQLDIDLTHFNQHLLAQPLIQAPHSHHHYQVHENLIDTVNSGENKPYYAPDADPSLPTRGVRPIDDPLSTPSNGQPKPADVLYHQSLDFGGNHFSSDPFTYSVTAQPQLQQFHLQQSSMVKQGMPLASLNPTYLVHMSNNLLGQHQQHLTSQLFRPENGYIDTSATSQPYQFDYASPQQAASLNQIYSAQKDQIHHELHSATQSPTTVSDYALHDEAASQENPAYSQILEPKPNHYQYSPQNFIDLPEAQLTQHDIQNLLSYNGQYQDYINHRQVENDLILREAQEKLQHKLNIQQQQQQTAYDLHQLVQQEKHYPLRIIVPDTSSEEQGVRFTKIFIAVV